MTNLSGDSAIDSEQTANNEGNKIEGTDPLANLRETVSCQACRQQIDPGASVCRFCQRNQNPLARAMNEYSPTASLVLSAFAVGLSVISFIATSADHWLRFTFGDRPALLATTSWGPDPTTLSYDHFGAPIVPIGLVDATVHVFNDGFAPTLLGRFVCTMDGGGSAVRYGETQSANELPERTHFVEFNYEAEIVFRRKSGGIAPQGSSAEFEFEHSWHSIEISKYPDFDELRGSDFQVLISASPSCRVEHRYAAELGKQATVTEFSEDALTIDGVVLLVSFVSGEIKKQISRGFIE